MRQALKSLVLSIFIDFIAWYTADITKFSKS